MVKVYFDNSVWIARFDGWRPRQQVDAIKRLVNAYKNDSITLYSSRKVQEELENIVSSKPEKKERAEQALAWMNSTHPQPLSFRPAIFGRAIFGEALFGQGLEFDKTALKNQDSEVAEFLTANDVQYFVSVDLKFLNVMERLLKEKGTTCLPVLPEDLVDIISALLPQSRDGIPGSKQEVKKNGKSSS